MKTLALLLLLASGCFVVPKTTTTTREVGTEEGAVSHGAPQAIALRAELRDSIVHIAATARRACARPIYAVVETKREKHARYRPNEDARAALPALIAAPITIPFSALGTAIALLADGDGTTTRAYRLVRTERFACTTPAEVSVAVRLPSGAAITERTDGDGVARVRIPRTEPYQGTITVFGQGVAEPIELRYALATPAITTVRETVTACGALHGVTGKVTVRLGIDAAGRPQRIGLDAGDPEFARCVSDGLATTRFGTAHRDAALVVPLELPAGG